MKTMAILKELEEEPLKWVAGNYIVLHTRITRGELLGLRLSSG